LGPKLTRATAQKCGGQPRADCPEYEQKRRGYNCS